MAVAAASVIGCRTPASEISTSVSALAQLATEYGMRIQASPGFVSGHVQGSRCDDGLLERYAELLDQELGLYPKQLVDRIGLSSIVLCEQLTSRGHPKPIVMDYKAGVMYVDVSQSTHDYGRLGLHHDLYHLIDYREDGVFGRDDSWRALNPPSFRYGSGGHAMQDALAAEYTVDQPGFLNRYSTSGIEEDKAELYAALMVNAHYVEHRCRNDKILTRKVAELKRSLSTFCTVIDAEFWRRARVLDRRVELRTWRDPHRPLPTAQELTERAAGLAGGVDAMRRIRHSSYLYARMDGPWEGENEFERQWSPDTELECSWNADNQVKWESNSSGVRWRYVHDGAIGWIDTRIDGVHDCGLQLTPIQDLLAVPHRILAELQSDIRRGGAIRRVIWQRSRCFEWRYRRADNSERSAYFNARSKRLLGLEDNWPDGTFARQQFSKWMSVGDIEVISHAVIHFAGRTTSLRLLECSFEEADAVWARPSDCVQRELQQALGQAFATGELMSSKQIAALDRPAANRRLSEVTALLKQRETAVLRRAWLLWEHGWLLEKLRWIE